ncbi:response regulator [Flavobacterium wongokense]|uniref:response regulator n=1 Tax=Flavobacterium wongokense TaxID=2910674 RepID=UPI001F3115AA|nr:response regulator [Flavobacterium sp. WG47]MCF6130668.1 response regulator [Flavobacterium sp. WG47]
MSKVICIIDDDPIYQFLINKIIDNSKGNHEVMFFKNGKEALDYFTLDIAKNLPDIILLDLEMPVMDGWDFLKEIDKLHIDDTAIYIVSSSISDEDKRRAKKFPKIKGHFSKPINSNKIQEITKKIE